MLSKDKFLPSIDGPEIFVGLVGPVGADLDMLCDALEVELSRVGYRSRTVRLSSLLHEFEMFSDLPTEPEEKRYHAHMNAGNELRRRLKRGDGLAMLAVAAIRRMRRDSSGSAITPAPRHAFILRSLKHPREVDLLRKVYGTSFFLLSVTSARDKRVMVLARRFAQSHGEMQHDEFRHEAEKIVVRDEAEVANIYGQNVRDTFPLADFFVSSDNKACLQNQVQVFTQILFGYPFHTPSKDEFGMFHARGAALRSADLSRQVGAVLCNQDGDILGMGCNEVPKAGGGLYWTGDANDQRDNVIGYDSNARIKEEILRELFRRLQKSSWLSKSRTNQSLGELLHDALYGTHRKPAVLKGTQIASLLEFGRMVHAEMAALMDAARLGTSVQGATMYCTTFPCHMCARHIVAAGVRRVVYIEPYPKSMAANLYPDSIVVGTTLGEGGGFVEFESFSGIAPTRYVDLFSMPERKDRHGRAVVWQESSAKFRLEQFAPSYILIENRVLEAFRKELARLKLGTASLGGQADA